MTKEYFDTSRNTQAEYIDWLWKEYSRLMTQLSIEKNPGRHGFLLDRLDDMYNNKINKAYDDHYKIHGYHYSEQPSLPHLSN
jgi:hypothetical protein